ncbi:DNA-directed RNA polymerase I subunit rpa49 [Entophlyctis luteolus]|nr:DNA-directed RNA polymerase I subunit rpa49 [Entophlyctis luteolus]
MKLLVTEPAPALPPICAAICDPLSGTDSAVFCSFTGSAKANKAETSISHDTATKDRVVLASLERVELRADSRDAFDSPVRYLVGVVDRSTNTVRLCEAPQLRFKTIVKARSQFKPSPLGAKNTLARHHLGEMFGTIKKKKAISAMERNKVKIESLASAEQVIKTMIDEAEVLLPSQEAVQNEIEEGRLIPPFDINATTPSKVYNLDSIMSPSELETIEVDFLLNVQYKEDLQSEINQVYPSAWVFDKIFQALQFKADKLVVKKVVYILFMMKFLTLRDNALNKPHPLPHYVDNHIQSSLLQKFTNSQIDNGVARYSFPDRLKDKLKAYILCACLILDDFRCDTTILAKDLNVSNSSVTTTFRELGCKIETKMKTNNIAILTTPLTFPPPKVKKSRK